jgi:hypothetical protein
MQKWLKQFLKYVKEPSNEFGFLLFPLWKKHTRLPANIFIDDGGTWTNIGTKRILLFQTNNSEQIDFDKLLPMSIENRPQILLNTKHIDLTSTEIEPIRDFVINCQQEIIQLADNKIGHLEFFEKISNKGAVQKLGAMLEHPKFHHELLDENFKEKPWK